MMSIEIRHRWNGNVIKTVDAETLSGANLSGADLRLACLRWADLRGADLRGADLRGADLRGADLRGADLIGADLSNADLLGADLLGADLSVAKNAPLIINGLRWSVHISGTGWMQIGCKQHPISEWDRFDDERINSMHSDALSFWKANKDMLLGLCRQYVHEEQD